ncbi:hypothetical protein HNP55_000506 [Paucibacter oligotrophus]|uniref:Secreted protein with PEP-CTERM sorting signal n=1 Tax=Roseateles oligotrophus TaxID=1769250 RepID=A0A840L2F0_9BURK|nr:PEP-CTERM sorting domain-containing protein [Roseateles oligotrophus]MBB4842011.1 hypothetical protein [Roseateles oligotrophus]
MKTKPSARPLRLAASLGLLACIGTAFASPVTMTGFTQGYEAMDTSMSGWVGVGQFTGRADFGRGQETLITFCTDIYQNFYWNVGYDYTLVANGTVHGFSSQEADLLGRLYTVAGAIDSTVKSVAFQLSIWEILYDQPQQLSLTGGNFALESGGSQAVRQQAASWLGQLPGVSSAYSVERLYSPVAQDFIIATPQPGKPSAATVPEPAGWALSLLALAAMGWVRHRST